MNKREVAEYMQKRLGLFANPSQNGYYDKDFLERDISFFFHDKANGYPINEDEIAYTKGEWKKIRLFYKFLLMGGANPRIYPENICQVVYSCDWTQFNWENAVKAIGFAFNGLDEQRAEYAERGLDVDKKVSEWREVIKASVWPESPRPNNIPLETIEDLEMVVQRLSELSGVEAKPE